MRIKNLSYKVLFIIIITIQLALLLFYMNNKTAFSVDEIYTFSLSNSSNGMFFSPKIFNKQNLDIQNKWLDGQIFKDYICVNQDNVFNYPTVYDNQLEDTHPPLYYYLIHTICSFFPNSFSKWYGFCLNLLLFLITQILLFIISKRILKSEKYSLLASIFYGFSLACINNFSYISTNTLITVFYLLMLNAVIKCLDNKFSFVRFVELFFIILLGGLTHYIFLLYSTFLIVSFVIFTFKISRKQSLWVLSTVMFGYLWIYLVFPDIINQILFSVYIQETIIGIDNIIPNIGCISYFIRKFLGIPFPYYFYSGALLFICIFIYTLYYFIKKLFNNEVNVLLTIIPIFSVIILISLGINYKITEIEPLKYFIGFFPIVAISFIAILKKVNKHYLLLSIVLLSFLSCLYKTNTVLFSFEKEKLSIGEIVSGKNVVLLINENENIQNYVLLLSQCKNVFITFYDEQNQYSCNTNNLPSDRNYFLLTNKNIPLNKLSYNKIISGVISSYWIDVYETTTNK